MPAQPPRVTDISVIGKNAKTPQERRQVFDAASVMWANDDVGKIQRIEPKKADGTAGDFYYARWIYPNGVETVENP